MSVTHSTAGSQNPIKSQADSASGQTDQASSKQLFQLFAEPAVTPLSTPITDSSLTAHAVKPTTVIDQKLLAIRQTVVLRAIEHGAVAFESGSYVRPTAQLATTLSAITQSLANNHAEFYHHG